MTEAQILQKINRVTAQRMALYRELAENDWLLHSQREALVKDVQKLDARIGSLYVELRAVRAGGVKVGMQRRLSPSGAIERLKRGRLRAPSALAATRPATVVGRRNVRREALARLRKGA